MINERKTKQRLEELRGYGFYLVPERVLASDHYHGIIEPGKCIALVDDFLDEGYEITVDRRGVEDSRYDTLMYRWNRSASTGIGREKHPLLRYLETRTTPWIIEQLAKPLSKGEPAREVRVGEGVIKVVREGAGITYDLELQPHRIICGKGRFSRKTTIYDFLLPHNKYTPEREG